VHEKAPHIGRCREHGTENKSERYAKRELSQRTPPSNPQTYGGWNSMAAFRIILSCSAPHLPSGADGGPLRSDYASVGHWRWIATPRATIRAPLITRQTTHEGCQLPKVKANGIAMNYDSQGTGAPLVLIPYLAADYACYAFQVAEYSKHFTCISLDLRGAGESDKPEGTYSTELFADDVAAFMQALDISRAHVAGLSLGAATGMWLAAKYPDRVMSVSLHSPWTKTDPFLKVVVEGWQVTAKALGSVPDMVVKGIFPWCFTPELYAARSDYIDSLAEFVRGRPAQPLDAFIRQSNAVLAHDAEAQLGKINAPTQITFGRHDMVTSTRFADKMTNAIKNSEVIVFEGCAHAPIYEKVDEFNQRTLEFLKRHTAQ
jgi:pimeloyl-ACP methyl ester carboxylesterase